MNKFEELPRGQLSTIILMTLQGKDKYGYEIIDEVLKNTSGKLTIKQPSLYSSLKRMEEQSLISSYWRESDIGGKRHYYHLSDLGKKYLEKWKTNIDLSQVSEQVKTSQNHQKVLQQENLFNITKDLQNNQEIQLNAKDDSFIQFDLFSNSTIISPPAKEDNLINQIKNQNISESLMQKPNQITYEKNEAKNKDLTKISNFNYAKKSQKSFFESAKLNNTYSQKYYDNNNEQNFINTKNNFDENSKNDELNENIKYDNDILNKSIEFIDDNNIKKDNENIQNNENQTNNTENTNINDISNINLNQSLITQENDLSANTQEIIKDDGIYITERLNPNDFPSPAKWNKISLSKFNNTDNSNLIKPKQQEIIQDLYQKQNSSLTEDISININRDKFYDEAELQNYYSSQNIYFSTYKKTSIKKNIININKFNCILSIIMFCFFSITSLIFGVLAKKDMYLNHPLTFIIFPLLSLILSIILLFKYLKNPNKSIKMDNIQINSANLYINFAIILINFVICLICGLNTNNYGLYFITFGYFTIIFLSYIVFYIFKKILFKIMTKNQNK